MTRGRGPRRFREQRWLVDEALRVRDVEFDQPRLGYHLGAVGDELAPAETAALRAGISKLADYVPVVRSFAERRTRRAEDAERRDHPDSAAVHHFAAAQMWSLACWPVWEDDALAHELDDRKNAAYLAWARHAAHRVERVDVPFGDAALPGWLHLPRGVEGPLPTVLAVGGMDAPREMLVARTGSPWLARGVAVLALDGPGQGEAAIRGVHVTPTAWAEAGDAVMDWIRGRRELDATRVVATGTSFGSFWMSQLASTQPGLLGCSVALPCFEPGAHTIFEQAPPTFKARHMWMAGLYDDEDAFDAMAARYDLRPHAEAMPVPWQIVGGTADDLSPSSWVHEMARRSPSPTSVTLYTGARHSMTEASAVAFGPGWRTLQVEWLHDRLRGRTPVSEDLLVLPSGEVTGNR
ncbi:alpha/beta hydrolase family protein [Pseudonocardia alni]|uniref:alpha/beta hydrolase family protein n=1 Tax=Pseudonocardia alni TaxID=33907 RepID=UPI00280BAE30|nr:alpha/beta hydrolase [Pseudonocardia alni]